MKRTIKKQFWLSKEEAKALHDNSAKTGLKEATFIRLLIKGFVPKVKPDEQFYLEMEKLATIVNIINKIVTNGAPIEEMNEKKLKTEIDALRSFRLALMEKYLKPDEAEWR